MTETSDVSAKAIEKKSTDETERMYRINLLADDITDFVEEYVGEEPETVILDAFLLSVGEWFIDRHYHGRDSDLEPVKSAFGEILDALAGMSKANWTKKICTSEDEDGSGCECGNDCGRCQTRSQIRSEDGVREIHVIIDGISNEEADRIVGGIIGGLRE